MGLSLSQKKSVSKKRTRKKTTINLAGGADFPQTPPRQAGGALPPQTPLLKLKFLAGNFSAEKNLAEKISAEKIIESIESIDDDDDLRIKIKNLFFIFTGTLSQVPLAVTMNEDHSHIILHSSTCG